jgi:hypothetical protein
MHCGTGRATERVVGYPQEQQPAAQPEMVEIDQWIVDFAHLFRDSTGLDFDRHVELHNLGFDKIQVRALRALPCDKPSSYACNRLQVLDIRHRVLAASGCFL